MGEGNGKVSGETAVEQAISAGNRSRGAWSQWGPPGRRHTVKEDRRLGPHGAASSSLVSEADQPPPPLN